MHLLRCTLLLAVLLLQGLVLLAQEAMGWSSDRPLVSDDFKGHVPVRPKRFTAVTVCHLSCNVNAERPDSITVDIGNVFLTRYSWKRRKKLNAYILKHEQDHFDIAELYARRIRQALGRCHKWYNASGAYRYAKLNRIFHRYRRRCRFAEYWYDFQTGHGRRRERQKEWNNKIGSLLTAYRQYEVK
jgi:hypothetical protein